MAFSRIGQSNKELFCMVISENINAASVEWVVVQSGVEGVTGAVFNDAFNLELSLLDTLSTIALVYANTTARAAIYANTAASAAVAASTTATALGAWG
jgi:hypothetical protein